MSINISGLQTFTDTEILTCYRYALATGAFRQEVEISGRRLKIPDAKTVRETITWLESRVNADGNIALGQYGES